MTKSTAKAKKGETAPSSVSGGTCAKMDRLSMVLSKAVDVSTESISKADVKECFGDLYGKLGSSIESNFMTLLVKTRKLIDSRFHELAEQRSLNARLAVLETTKPALEVLETSAGEDDILGSTVMDIQKMEAEQLKVAIAKMESDMDGYRKKMATLQTQLKDQKAALGSEHDKFQAAADAL